MTTQNFGRIAWIGAGKLGLPMAARIAAAGYDIVAYDVSAQRVAEAKEAQAGDGRLRRRRGEGRQGRLHVAARRQGAAVGRRGSWRPDLP